MRQGLMAELCAAVKAQLLESCTSNPSQKKYLSSGKVFAGYLQATIASIMQAGFHLSIAAHEIQQYCLRVTLASGSQAAEWQTKLLGAYL